MSAVLDRSLIGSRRDSVVVQAEPVVSVDPRSSEKHLIISIDSEEAAKIESEGIMRLLRNVFAGPASLDVDQPLADATVTIDFGKASALGSIFDTCVPPLARAISDKDVAEVRLVDRSNGLWENRLHDSRLDKYISLCTPEALRVDSRPPMNRELLADWQDYVERLWQKELHQATARTGTESVHGGERRTLPEPGASLQELLNTKKDPLRHTLQMPENPDTKQIGQLVGLAKQYWKGTDKLEITIVAGSRGAKSVNQICRSDHPNIVIKSVDAVRKDPPTPKES